MINKTKGFTLIELLVVIAIIGILSSVVLTSLSTARTKASVAAAQAAADGMRPNLVICLNDGNAPVIGANETAATWTAVAMCASTGMANYPALPSGWVYCDATVGTGCDVASSASVTTFSISIFNTNMPAGSKHVTCTESACTVS